VQVKTGSAFPKRIKIFLNLNI